MIKLSTIKLNPNNPRLIKDERFKKLVQSIKEFPKMLDLRPLVIDDTNTVLGGNMRLAALKQLGYTEVPENWIKSAKDLNADEIRRFIIADNVSFGEHDWDMLANEWEEQDLADWGLDIPNFDSDLDNKKEGVIEDQEIAAYKKHHILLSFHPDIFLQIKELIQPVLNLEGVEYEQSNN